MTDRSEYFHNRYISQKNNGLLNWTPERRAIHNSKMREYRKKNAMVIKIARSLDVSMKEARRIIKSSKLRS